MPDELVVKLTGPKEVNSMSIGGVQLPVIDGMIEVPAKFAEQLASHGFVPYIEPEKPAPAPPMGKSARKGTAEQGY